MKRLIVAMALLFACAAAPAPKGTLTIIQAGPVGEIATLAEANEIRVVFSEPMIVVGKIPPNVRPAWFHIAPNVQGAFRWSGTTTLIFTPAQPLPFATKYDVTVDAEARSVKGNTLDQPYSSSFITPTIKLLRTDFYRKEKKYDGSVLIGLWFNQPVDRNVIVQHLTLRTKTHTIEPLEIPAAGVERLKKLEPQTLAAFQAKKAKAEAAAASDGAPVLSFLTDEWDEARWPKVPELVVLETKPGIAADTNIQVFLDTELARSPANVKTGVAQTFTIELPPAFFVRKVDCVAQCSPEDSNPIIFRAEEGVPFPNLVQAVTVTDVTDPAHEVVVKPGDVSSDTREYSESYSFDELGYSLLPAHTYALRIDPKLEAKNGEQLGYTYMAVVEYWHRPAFTSFGGGHGVWESGGGPLLPFYSRNYKTVKQWMQPLKIEDTMPTILRLREKDFAIAPDVPPKDRKLTPVPDKIQSYGVDITPAVGSDGKGLLWAAVQQGEPIPKAKPYDPQANIRSTIVQVTNLGISVKDSPQNTLVLVTRLDNAEPVAGAKVSIRTPDNKVFWTGTTDAHGLVTAPNTDLRANKGETPSSTPRGEMDEDEESYDYQALDGIHFIVTAEKDGDTAYVASDWNEGVSPWAFEVGFDLNERRPTLRGTVFTDRGVYKLGEEVHFKGILRSDTPNGMKLLQSGSKVELVIKDSHDKEVDTRTLALTDWSSAEWTWKVPADGALGTYTINASVPGQRLHLYGDFLVAAYRRPDFRVDTTLGAKSSVAGTKLDGKVTARYLFGSPMSSRPVKWSYRRMRSFFYVPSKIMNRFPAELWTFVGCYNDCYTPWEDISSKEQKLNQQGELKVSLPTTTDAGYPYNYQFEGDVTDVSRQTIAGRATFWVDPAPWYVGLKRLSYFVDSSKGLDTEIVAPGLDGTAVAGVKVEVSLTRIFWNSVRQSEGNGLYTWTSEEKKEVAQTMTVTTKAAPVPLHIDFKNGGYYVINLEAKDAEGHVARTVDTFYAIGPGYTSWERYDHNRIDLVPEKKNYKPGETARIMVKSPWEKATALLTTEREGVRTSKTFELTSTQQTVSVPITERDIPNVFVSVLLVKGRTKEAADDDSSDPGKPSFRLGYVELKVEDAAKRLHVDVKANREEYRPATKAKIEVDVKDAKAKGTQSEVTLWAVDYGVLSLTAYQTPDVLKSIYLEKSLQVVNEDSRQMIINRRVMTPKGAGEGGGGGRDSGPGMIRKDFRVLAFWLGSVTTDKNGHAKTEVTLPESLTTYRIMAVAADKASRFGWSQAEIKINKPVLLTQAYPRFLAVGDKAYFGSVIHSTLKQKGTATVTMKSLDPAILEIDGEPKLSIDVPVAGSVEARFHANAKAIGDARVQMTVSLNGETDAFEDVIPVRILVSPETVAAYGSAKPQASETLEIPEGVVPTFGGVHLELASTAMVGLGEGAQYLVDYPYGCAEQRSSGALALILTSDLGDAFHLQGIDPKKGRAVAQATINELPKFQCGDGGFTYWAGECTFESPYLTSWVLHVMQTGQKLKYTVDPQVLNRAYDYLDKSLAEKRPENEGWWPSYTAWQAFSVKVLTEGGRNEDSNITRLMTYVDRMPLFGVSNLADALIARNDHGPRLEELRRRMKNAILPEGGTAHVEELTDPYLMYFWNSNIRSTAIVLGSLVRNGQDQELATRMVRWLMKVRKQGRWGNTQENAWAMEALIEYYRKYESEVPDFTGIVSLGKETLARETFKGRSAEAKNTDVPMQQLLTKGAPGTQLPVTFDRQGTGTLYYMLRLRYAQNIMHHDRLDQGFWLERSYSMQGGKGGPLTSFKAGDLVKVTLKIRNTKERRFVAITDPIPAGTEPVESWFATTASALAEEQQRQEAGGGYWWAWWEHGGFDHVERHDDRVNLFATRLSEGMHEFTYVLRATTAGTFTTAPLHAEEMYEPEVFGRTATDTVEVKP